ncbi:ATPase domain-containing protein [Desulfosoma caldarium]|uniref:non-specific serine/threonine protein kinase n=1 Tax=Desulfosoma caldarium TaxID=610254 RepID=A0A3N1V0E5_9BACT|nr:ATPase domain-containing protein [Desulfosoma caldarium]ROQ93611.1 circadian clock protein KaiC [Desulfosoma caldarium]
MQQTTENRLSTGIKGLDEILAGGLLPGRAYLLHGGPGTGKTTLGLHFLVAGAAQGERALFITLEEWETSLRKNAAAVGLDLSGIDFLDISPGPEYFCRVQTYDIFAPAEVEREPLTETITEAVERIHPVRVFIDSLTQFRYLSSDVFQFRKQVLSFLQFLTQQGATVVFTSEYSPDHPDDDLQFMADGIIELDCEEGGRSVSIRKFRGSSFKGGKHSMVLTSRGMAVFPRLIPEEHGREFLAEAISTEIPELDALMHGGVERGTISIITGPSGVGKTTLGILFMKEAARRGERSVMYSFEESLEPLIHRSEAVKIPVRSMLEKGTLSVVQVEPLRYTSNEFAWMVRREVEEKNARIVMIDSLSGYRLSLRGGDLVSHLHALCKYLSNMGVTVFLINEVEAITGDFKPTELGISYLADNIVILRYLEMAGELRKAIGVLKKRLSDFEKTLREFEITGSGVKVGPPLRRLRGILTGVPNWVKGEEEK